MTSLTIVRRIAARPAIVFDALTTPEGIALRLPVPTMRLVSACS